VQFNYGGKYRVCLTASNGVGKGNSICKNDYILVTPAYNIGDVAVVRDPEGNLFDNGGPNGDYSYDSKLESTLIDPCADSVFLTFSKFDLYCGYDYLRIFEGRNNSGKNISGSCTRTGSYIGAGPGFTGGKANPVCAYPCMPNVTKPDTFVAKNVMYLEMSCYAAYQSAGFAAHWWSTPRKSATKPKAAFTISLPNDSICTNGTVNYVNTTKIDPNDPATFLWDLDGDMTNFECIGTCTAAAYPYFAPGPVNITLIAINCGGADTVSHTITVFNPKKPKTAILADNTTPTTAETVYFSAPMAQCVDNYRWTISRSKTTATGTATYVNKTSSNSVSPQVVFSDTGYYDVKLYTDNLGGTQKDSLTIFKYIHVRIPYCVPTVATLNPSIGITNFVFNTISNTTKQASQAYYNFVNNPSFSTTVMKGLTYPLTITQDINQMTDNVNRTVYIDWDHDGSFVANGDIIVKDSNATYYTYSTKITIPKNVKTGATVLRLAINKGAYSNKPCGQNETGGYQDYRVYVMPYSILPVITLKGNQGSSDTIFVDQANVFADPGFRATSFLYGNLTGSVVRTSRKIGSSNPNDTFNSLFPGPVYIFSYNVTDSAGNKAVTVFRVVKIIPDRTPPNLIVDKPDTVYIAVTKKAIHPVPVPKVISCIDLLDGPLPVKIDSGKVRTDIVGIYVVAYTSTDLSGNTITVDRVVDVIDSIKPGIALKGKDTLLLEVKTPYKEPGYNVSDNYYADTTLLKLISINNDIDTGKLGYYQVVYSLTDPSGNNTTIIRTVKVVDTIPPVITQMGSLKDSIAVFSSYTDPGFVVSDNYDKTSAIKTSLSGSYYTQFPSGKPATVIGVYTIVYRATDLSGNTSVLTRTLKVQDRDAPIIILTGPVSATVCRWFKYVDDGYVVTDNYDKIQDLTIDTLGTFVTKGGTTNENYLDLYYTATDKSGNIGTTAYRLITVKSNNDPACVSGIDPGKDYDNNISIYPNPGTGIFTIKTGVLLNENATITVTNILGQSIGKFPIYKTGESSFQIDLSDQPPGNYFLVIETTTGKWTKRLEVAK